MDKDRNRVPFTWLYLVGKTILYPYYRLVYRLRPRGLENIPESGPVLLCCNHLSARDPLVLGVLLRRQIFYMGKAELFENKFLGWLLRKLGVFPVVRGSGGEDALKNARDLLDKGAMVGVFIEGTRSKTGELGRPKTGAALLAAESGAVVVPACITGESGSFPRAFKKTIVAFGRPMTRERLCAGEISGLRLRHASREIMGEIAGLRAEARREFGLPVLPENADEPEKEGNGP